MLIHITPSFLNCAVSGWNCDLVDLVIPEFDLHLVAGKDLLARRPYPNKNYHVVSAKSSRKALVGLLIDTPQHIRSFTAKTRWAVTEGYVVEHEVEYVITDDEHDAATDRMVLWNYSRLHTHTGSPESAKPIFGLSLSKSRERTTDNEYNADGKLVRIRDRFEMPTVESECIDPATVVWCRQPPFATAFKV